MPVFPFQRATRTFQAFPDYEILLKYTELRKFGLGPLPPASTACAEGSDGKATSRPPEVSAEKPLLSW